MKKQVLLASLLGLTGLVYCLVRLQSARAQDTAPTPPPTLKPAPRLPFVRYVPGHEDEFVEPAVPGSAPDPANWTAAPDGLQIGFAPADTRFARHEVPSLSAPADAEWSETGWRGERLNTQLLVWSKTAHNNITVQAGDLSGDRGAKIATNHISTGFERYVLSDATAGACGSLSGRDLTPLLVADPIDPVASTNLPAMSVQPVWTTLAIPRDARPGVYHGTLAVFADGAAQPATRLPFTIRVLASTLPAPRDWSYHLDLWQHPLRVSDYYRIKPWSDEHFAKLRPLMEMLRDAGQKVITTCVLWDQWNGSSNGLDNAYIKPIKGRDGQWSYDYTNFDKWVEFMMKLGIDRQINCYGMAPWVNNFFYYDVASGSEKVLQVKPGTPAYDEYWTPFLRDFADHLKKKGWFDRTALAIDERSEGDTNAVVGLIKRVQGDFKIAYSGKYYPALEPDIYDYSLTLKKIPADTLARRHAQCKITTYYTCCWELAPNTFTCSAAADARWLSWFSASNNFDGYVRYAYNLWETNSLNDTRNSQLAAGDNLLVYPGARSSIRFELLIDGIQDYEKLAIVRARLERSGDMNKQTQLNALLAPFKDFSNPAEGSAAMVAHASEALNKLS